MKLRSYADLFAFFNRAEYQELVYFENYFVKSVISNFEEMSSKSINLITANHEHWAELVCNFTDIKKVISNVPAVK